MTALRTEKNTDGGWAKGQARQMQFAEGEVSNRPLVSKNGEVTLVRRLGSPKDPL